MLTTKQRKNLVLLFNSGNLTIENGSGWREASADFQVQCLHRSLTGKYATAVYAALRARRRVIFSDAELGVRLLWEPARVN